MAPNGVVARDVNPHDFLVDTQDYLDSITFNGRAWDTGSINEFFGSIGTASLINGIVRSGEDFSAADWGPGLYVQCLRSTLRDDVNDLTWTYEDYAWLWVDEAPFLLAPSWLDNGAWDGRSSEDHCSDINPLSP